jgi:hypothetical protein
MNRKSFAAVLLTLLLAVAVTPAAASVSGPYTAGHFELSVDGHAAVYAGAGTFSSPNTIVLGGQPTAALVSWARSGALRDAILDVHDGYGRVDSYQILSAGPTLEGGHTTLRYEYIKLRL